MKDPTRRELNKSSELISIFGDLQYHTYKLGRGKQRAVYKWIHAGFDIETTTLYQRDDHDKPVDMMSIMWIWQFSINDYVFFGRYWKEFIFFINTLSEALDLNKDLKIYAPVFIHNMSFEMQHMRCYLDKSDLIDTVFARNERQPLKLLLKNGLIFLDSAKITNSNLAGLAKYYTTTQKLVGDLDYTLLRGPETKSITDLEYDYCSNDVIILAEYSLYYERQFINGGHYMPITSTSMVRHELKRYFNEAYDKAEKKQYHQFIWKCFPYETDYRFMMQYLFQGGYVHGNIINIGKIIEKDLEADKKSAYPWMMFTSDRFPMGPFRRVKPELVNVYEMMEKYACWMVCEFRNLKAKTSVTTISKNKCISILSPQVDNGRIYKAKKICLALTEMDFEIVNKYYDFSKVKFLKMRVAKRGYLPAFIRKLVIEFFINKESTPKEDKKLYNLRKALLNSIYGCFVTRLVFDEISYQDGEWKTTGKDKEEIGKVFVNAKRQGLLLPQWGVWVTSGCRHDILSVVWDLMHVTKSGVKDYLYTDTDSIKTIYRQAYIAYYKQYNEKVIAKNMELMRDLGIAPEVIEKVKILGIYEIEGSGRFKTLGAKRYLSTAGGDLTCTVAGLPKHVIPAVCEEKGKDPFAFFRHNMRFTYTDSDKLTAYYIDEPRRVQFTDIDGNKVDEEVLSCLPLIPTTFQMGLTSDFMRLIRIMQGMDIERGEINGEL